MGNHRLNNGAESDRIVGGGERIGITEIDLVLPRSLFVVRALGLDAHLLQDHADLPADVLSLVLGSHVHIARLVIGLGGGIARLVGLKEIKFHLRAESKGVTLLSGLGHSLFQQPTGVGIRGVPSGWVTSQNMRTTRPFSGRQGRG